MYWTASTASGSGSPTNSDMQSFGEYAQPVSIRAFYEDELCCISRVIQVTTK